MVEVGRLMKGALAPSRAISRPAVVAAVLCLAMLSVAAPGAAAANNSTPTATATVTATETPPPPPLPNASGTVENATETVKNTTENVTNRVKEKGKDAVDDAQSRVPESPFVDGPAPTPLPERPTYTYSLEELQRNGERSGPVSNRWVGLGSVTLRHQPVGGAALSYPWRYVRPWTEVNRNQVKLVRSVSPEADPAEQVTVHVVYWKKGTWPVEKGNRTVSVPVALNVTEDIQTVDLSAGYGNASVDLRPHYDDSWQVTMWLEQAPDTARWRFTHHSVPTAAAAPDFSNIWDLLLWGIVNLVLPAGISSYLFIRVSSRVVDKAVIGPKLNIFKYIVAAGGLLILLAYVFFFQLSTILAKVPWVLGLLVGPVAGVVHLRYASGNYSLYLFLRPELGKHRHQVSRHAKEAAEETGGDVEKLPRDALFQDGADLPMAETAEGCVPIRLDHIRHFLARVMGKAATLRLDEIQTEIPMRGKWSAAYYADPSSDAPIRWRPATVTLSPREAFTSSEGWRGLDVDRLVKAASGVGVAVLVLQGWLGLPLVAGLAAIGVLAASSVVARRGEIQFEPGPVHMRGSIGTLLQLREDYELAMDLEEAQDKWLREKGRNRRKLAELEERRDESLLDGMLGEVDEAESVADGNDLPDLVTNNDDEDGDGEGSS